MFNQGNPDSENHKWLIDYVLNHLVGLGGGNQKNLKEVILALAEEMNHEQDDQFLLFCGSDGKFVIKALHFPEEVLGAGGPVFLPSSNPKVIVAAYSDEFLQIKVDDIEGKYEEKTHRDQQWEIYLNGLALDLAQRHEAGAKIDEKIFGRPGGYDEFDEFLEDVLADPKPRKYDQWPYDQDNDS